MAGTYSRGLSRHNSASKKNSKRRPKSPLFPLKPRTFICLFFLFLSALLFFQGRFPAGPQSKLLERKTNFLHLGGHKNSTLKARYEVGEAITDITTKDLYDRIQFEDKDGGVWKQGWDVRYEGSEWDEEKLKVFVVPHSHNDPGWIRTVEEYYQERTRHILDNVVESLLKDKRRKFIWEEMSYLERWWRDASNTSKDSLIGLVKSGQLEIVGGGWVMNDEANSHYFAIIEQMTAGNLWLLDTVGVVPKNAWAIDPFGHSPTMAYLLRRMGFENMLIQRTHYEVKKELAWNKNLEFNWRQSWDAQNSTDIFCHMMPFYSYDIPHTCGPEPGVCCQFDFWRGPRGAGYCPWRKQPQLITSENVKERAELLLDQYRKKSTLYRSNTLLVPLGDDFRYSEMEEANLAYENYQRIFDYINVHPHLKTEAQFGTLEDYFRTLRQEAGDAESTEGSESPLRVAGFPSLAGDFFTYADRQQDYWSGYYVTRPFYKAVDRVLEHTLRAAEILFTLTKALRKESATRFGDVLEQQRRNLALFQHHDGVTGTAKDHVVVDYALKMHGGIVDLAGLMASSVGAILSNNSNGMVHTFEPAELHKGYDMLAEKKTVEVKNFKVQHVAIYNPLEETVEQVVTVLVDNAAVCVFDNAGNPVLSQLSPNWVSGTEANIMSKNHRLHFKAKVSPLGLATYLITGDTDNCDIAFLSSLSIFNVPEGFTCPDPYLCTRPGDVNEKTSITNGFQTLVFSARTGLLGSHRSAKGKELDVEEEIAMYSSAGSGAYLFAPDGEAHPIVEAGGIVVVTRGPLLEEVYSVPKCTTGRTPLVRAARLYAGSTVQSAAAEFKYFVDFASNEFNNREVIARFKTELNNKQVFYTDLNGFQTIRRETYSKIPLQGNYYPMPSLAFLQCPGGRRFSVHSRQGLGVASLKKGWLEIMLDRRLLRDDERGLGQGIMDNRPSRVGFALLVEQNVSESPFLAEDSPRAPSLLSHRIGSQLNYPLHMFFAMPQPFTSVKATVQSSLDSTTSLSPLQSDLPCDIHIVGLKVPRPVKTAQELGYGILLQRRGYDPSYAVPRELTCDTVDQRSLHLFTLFKQLEVTKAQKTSLTFAHDDADAFEVTDQVHRKLGLGAVLSPLGYVDLVPMEIQAYKLELKSLG